jgi:hypothetical protein
MLSKNLIFCFITFVVVSNLNSCQCKWGTKKDWGENFGKNGEVTVQPITAEPKEEKKDGWFKAGIKKSLKLINQNEKDLFFLKSLSL